MSMQMTKVTTIMYHQFGASKALLRFSASEEHEHCMRIEAGCYFDQLLTQIVELSMNESHTHYSDVLIVASEYHRVFTSPACSLATLYISQVSHFMHELSQTKYYYNPLHPIAPIIMYP